MRILICLALGLISLATEADPLTTVDEFHARVQSLAQYDDAARVEAATAILEQTHDLQMIGRMLLGRNWAELGASEQAAFTDRFETLSALTLTSRFGDAEIAFKTGATTER
ncbi:MAG: ABC transporter substrate-binding protein, partial [Gammaproteobacteria bacterium]|nr:ABC transporter substrate-binding protein [Gammaproteobacteria bacterium]